MAKQIKFNEEARAAMKKGIDKLADAVRMTLGASSCPWRLKRATWFFSRNTVRTR